MLQARSTLEKWRLIGPPCTECAHFIGERRQEKWPNRLEGPFCGHPAYEKHAIDPVTGVVSVKQSTTASAARSEQGLCGLDAALFEPHPLPVRAINAIGKNDFLTSTLWLGGAYGVIALLSYLL
jgi:hypothetical protein